MEKARLLQLHRTRCRRIATFDQRPLQLGLGGDPWKVILACQLLNRTRGTQARPALAELLRRWPSPRKLARAAVEDVEETIRGLGLQRRRAARLIDLARAWVHKTWTHPGELPGVGQYTLDALRIFCLDDLEVDPQDRVLAAYLATCRGRGTPAPPPRRLSRGA